MKYELKQYCLNKGTLVDDKTMGQVLRRLSKTARKYLEQRGLVAIVVDGYCFVLFRSQHLLNITGVSCTRTEYELFNELAWRSKNAIKAYESRWSMLHEVDALQ